MLDRWKEYRRRQRAALRESNRPSGLARVRSARWTSRTRARPADQRAAPDGGCHRDGGWDALSPEPARARGRFGAAGRPLNRQSPFYVGFVGAFGVIIALGLWHLLGRLSAVLTLIVVAFFLTLALDPIVQFLTPATSSARPRWRSSSPACWSSSPCSACWWCPP